jgi:hypothetical protein
MQHDFQWNRLKRQFEYMRSLVHMDSLLFSDSEMRQIERKLDETAVFLREKYENKG